MDTTSELAVEAANLATGLHFIAENCGHEAIAADITSIATELTTLSSTLTRLQEAMVVNEPAYTATFHQDLGEITSELKMIFEEVQECSLQLQKADPASYTVASWFFRKGRATRLQKHLAALKTTVAVMRMVLYHGKDYGTQISPGRLAESAPHTMSEDRAILESVFAKNRDAIGDLQDHEKNPGHKRTGSKSSEPGSPLSPGAHGRNLSFATGVDTISVPDVLPPRDGLKKNKLPSADGLARRFSKRVGLGVHKSIMEIKANETEIALRKRWIKADMIKHLPSIAESNANPSASLDSSTGNAIISRQSSGSPMSLSRSNSLALMGSNAGKSLSRAIRGLAFGNKSKTENKASEDGSSVSNSTSNGEPHVPKTNEKRGVFATLKQKLSKPVLRTPDYNQEFENGV